MFRATKSEAAAFARAARGDQTTVSVWLRNLALYDCIRRKIPTSASEAADARQLSLPGTEKSAAKGGKAKPISKAKPRRKG